MKLKPDAGMFFQERFLYDPINIKYLGKRLEKIS